MLSFHKRVKHSAAYGARTVKGNEGDNILYAFGAELFKKVFHPLAFKLENACGVPRRKHVIGLPVIQIKLLHVSIYAVNGFYVLHCAVYDRKVFEAEEVELDKTNLLQRVLLELSHNFVILPLAEGNINIQRLIADDYPRCVHPCVPQEPFQLAGVSEYICPFLYLRKGGFQIAVGLQRLVYGHPRRFGYGFGKLVHILQRNLKHPPHITHRAPAEKLAEGDNLRHPVIPVFAADVIDHLFTSVYAEVYIEVGHGLPFGVEETLKQQVEADGVYIRYAEGVSHERARARTPSGADGYLLSVGIIYEVPHY